MEPCVAIGFHLKIKLTIYIMISFLKKSLQEGTQIDRANIFTAVFIGGTSHIILHFLYAYIIPLPYESLTLRLIITFLCISTFCYPYLPEKIKVSYFPFYWHLMVMSSLTFNVTLLALKNNFNEIYLYWGIFTTFLLAIYVPNWFMFIVDFIVSIVAGFMVYLATTPIINLAPEFNVSGYGLILFFTAFSGVIFVHANKSVWLSKQHQQHLQLTSLAGSIVHEIRNPLNAINLSASASDAVLKSDQDNKISEALKYNDHIFSSIKKANEIINIALSDLKDKPVDSNDFSYPSANKILPEIIKNYGYSSEAEKAKVKLDLKDNFIFRVIDDRFTFIIYNLLKNALYYLNQYPDSIVTIGVETFNPGLPSLRVTKNGSAAIQNVDVEVTGLPHHASMVRNDGSGNGGNGSGIDYSKYNVIYVYDTGPGIPSNILPKLFGDFFTSGKKEGTGLGLAFCKRNMKIFGGDIIVESELGKDGNNGWTKFNLLLPKLTEEEIKAAETEAKRKKILIVDDQETNLIATKLKIEKSVPYIVCDIALSGLEALKLAKANKYYLILTDVQMPEINGILFAKEIRKFNKDIPIIAYTSLDLDLEEIKSVTNDYISKSVPNHILLRTISKWLIGYNDDFFYLGSKEEYIAAIKDKNILLADDQKINLMMTKRNLENYGLKVTEASDGKELLEIYNQNPNQFNLIITDINMSSYNGDQAAKEIRKTNKTIPIIALSGDGEKEDIYHFLACGMNDYFIKGNDTELLIKIIANYLIKKDDMNITKAHNQIIKNQQPIMEELDLLDDVVIDNNDKIHLILDLEKINSFDKADQKTIMELFLKESEKIITLIRHNINAELHFNIHSLKGISGNIGAIRLFEYTKEIDTYFKQNKPIENENWIAELEEIYEETVGEVERFLDN